MDQGQHLSTPLSASRRHISTQGEELIRVIMTADNHLSAYSPRLSPVKLSGRRRRLRAAFRQTIDTAIERQAHLFIQAGDLFDMVDPRNLEREFVAAQLKRLQAAGIQTFAVSGNHDTPRQKTEQGGTAPQSIYHQLGGMHYFASSDQLEPVLVEAAGLRIAVAGLSYHPGVLPGADPLDHVQLYDPEEKLSQADLGLLILHAALEGHAFPGEKEVFVRRSSLDRFDGFQVVLSGHVHAYDRFNVGNKAVVVCGATERMEYGQSEDRTGFVYLELTRQGLQHSEHIPIKPQPRHVITIRTTELWPPQQPAPNGAKDTPGSGITSADNLSPTERIIQKLEPFCTEETMVKLVMEGPITREHYHQLDLRSIWLYGQEHAFSFELDESRLLLKSEHDDEMIERGERVAPREMMETIIYEWMEQSDSPEARAILAKTRQRVLERYDELSGKEVGA